MSFDEDQIKTTAVQALLDEEAHKHGFEVWKVHADNGRMRVVLRNHKPPTFSDDEPNVDEELKRHGRGVLFELGAHYRDVNVVASDLVTPQAMLPEREFVNAVTFLLNPNVLDLKRCKEIREQVAAVTAIARPLQAARVGRMLKLTYHPTVAELHEAMEEGIARASLSHFIEAKNPIDGFDPVTYINLIDATHEELGTFKRLSQQLREEYDTAQNQARENTIARTPGVDQMERRLQKILGSVGLEAKLVKRNFGRMNFTIKLTDPKTRDEVEYAARRLNHIMERVKKIRGKESLAMEFLLEGKFVNEPDWRPNVQESYAALSGFTPKPDSLPVKEITLSFSSDRLMAPEEIAKTIGYMTSHWSKLIGQSTARKY